MHVAEVLELLHEVAAQREHLLLLGLGVLGTKAQGPLVLVQVGPHGHAARDTGNLLGWTLNLETEPGATVEERESAPHTAIPDANGVGIQDELPIAVTGAIRSLEVELYITHTWIGDLQVVLSSPDHQDVLLHNRGGSSRHDIRGTFATGKVPALDAMLGRQAQGKWKLKVIDHAPDDVGTLNSWKLRVTTSKQADP